MKTMFKNSFLKKAFTLAAAGVISFRISASAAVLSGNYTIGEGGDFRTISEAAEALNNNGVSGAVTFMLMEGNYYEQVQLNEIRGASASSTITITTESGENDVIWAYASTRGAQNYTLNLNGTDYLRIMNITFEARGVDYARIVYMSGSCDNNIFENVVFNAPETDIKGQNTAIIYSPNGSDEDGITIANCEFNGGSSAIALNGSGSFGDLETNTTIEANNFFNQYEASVDLYYHDAPVINNNIIQTNSSSADFTAMKLVQCNNGMRITHNIIYADYGRYGIYLNGCAGTESAKGLMENNSIYLSGTFSTNGIYLSGNTQYQNLNLNKVKIGASEKDNLASFYTNNSSGRYIELYNNIFFNLGDHGYSVVGNTIKLANFETRPNDMQKTYITVRRVTKEIDVTADNIATFSDPEIFIQ